MLALVENVRRKQLAWIDAVLRHRNWNMSQLAAEAGISHTTLSKWKNDEQGVAQLGTRTVTKIENASGLPAYQSDAPAMPRGLAENEAAPYIAAPGDGLREAIAALKGGRNGVDAWVLRSRALESAGYLPGDVLMVDLNAEPHNGDAVCAQVYDRYGRAETVMRLYEDPFLHGSTLDSSLMRPLLVDGDRVLVRGVVISALRPRRAA